MDATQLTLIVVAAIIGMLVKDVSVLVILVKLYQGMLDKAQAKHHLQEHVIGPDHETTKTRLIRCDHICPLHRTKR